MELDHDAENLLGLLLFGNLRAVTKAQEHLKKSVTSNASFPTKNHLSDALMHSWNQHTCDQKYAKKWGSIPRTAGQRDISAFIAKSFFGGNVCRETAVKQDRTEIEFYFNILPDGTEFDFVNPLVPSELEDVTLYKGDRKILTLDDVADDSFKTRLLHLYLGVTADLTVQLHQKIEQGYNLLKDVEDYRNPEEEEHFTNFEILFNPTAQEVKDGKYSLYSGNKQLEFPFKDLYFGCRTLQTVGTSFQLKGYLRKPGSLSVVTVEYAGDCRTDNFYHTPRRDELTTLYDAILSNVRECAQMTDSEMEPDVRFPLESFCMDNS